MPKVAKLVLAAALPGSAPSLQPTPPTAAGDGLSARLGLVSPRPREAGAQPSVGCGEEFWSVKSTSGGAGERGRGTPLTQY